MRQKSPATPPHRCFAPGRCLLFARAIFALAIAAPFADASEFRAPPAPKRPLFAPPPKPPIADEPTAPEPARGASPIETPTPAAPPPIAPAHVAPTAPAPVAHLPSPVMPALANNSAHPPNEPFTPQKVAPIPGTQPIISPSPATAIKSDAKPGAAAKPALFPDFPTQPLFANSTPKPDDHAPAPPSPAIAKPTVAPDEHAVAPTTTPSPSAPDSAHPISPKTPAPPTAAVGHAAPNTEHPAAPSAPAPAAHTNGHGPDHAAPPTAPPLAPTPTPDHAHASPPPEKLPTTAAPVAVPKPDASENHAAAKPLPPPTSPTRANDHAADHAAPTPVPPAASSSERDPATKSPATPPAVALKPATTGHALVTPNPAEDHTPEHPKASESAHVTHKPAPHTSSPIDHQPTPVPDDYEFKIRAATDSNSVPFHLEALVKSTTNLVSKADSLRHEQRQRKLNDYQTQLDVARQQRRDKEPARAIATLLELLGSEAPAGFKRPALYELALAHHEDNQLIRAQQIFSHYLKQYEDDPMTPEIHLRQGMIYRQLGTHNLAVGKFYAVMNSALSLKQDKLEYYKTLVLHAQTEIADTYFAQNKLTEAADFYQRLLKLPGTELNRPQIQFKLVRTLAYLDRHTEAVAHGRMLLNSYPTATEIPETRYQIAMSLKALNKTADALEEVLSLLQTQKAVSDQDPANWAYWQQRTGNEIANHFYREHNDLDALSIYQSLAKISSAPAWQLPVLYQTGLVFERLRQPAKAIAAFDQILQRANEREVKTQLALATVLDMARWRKDHVNWQEQADRRSASLHTVPLTVRTLPAEFRTSTFDTLAAAQSTTEPISQLPTPTFSPIGSSPKPTPIPTSTPSPKPISKP